MDGPILKIYLRKKLHLHFYKIFNNVGARQVFVWALDWAWHPSEINLHFPRISRICMPNPKFLPYIVSDTLTVIRTDG